LLTPTRIYVRALHELKKWKVEVKGCCHITGGGFYENIPRMLPEGIEAVINKGSYEIPAIFRMLQKDGNIEEKVMYNTYNMGLGMIIAVDKTDGDKALKLIQASGERAYIVGETRSGARGIRLV
jgi:phosphoribosylformylglycinamidine cyclo-ligase